MIPEIKIKKDKLSKSEIKKILDKNDKYIKKIRELKEIKTDRLRIVINI
jgi:hypothetical protein